MFQSWLMATLLFYACGIYAGEKGFFRIQSSGTTVLVGFWPDGTLVWSNAVPWSTGTVQWADSITTPHTPWKAVHYFAASAQFMGIVLPLEPPPDGMVLIPEGSFAMGNATNVFLWTEGYSDELPQHTVFVSGFYMDPHHVTQTRWSDVRSWGLSHGYADLPLGSWNNGTNYSKGPSHPVHLVNWFDCVKWCNARSEKDGLSPAYYVDSAFSNIYKTGEIAPYADWTANGYRLPTEAEWEKAARGGVAFRRFPWFDSHEIQHARANYFSRTNELYDTSSTRGYHPTYATGIEPYTSPVGSFAPNSHGLYDMAGNVWDWCWDWYSMTYYSVSPSVNPRGPDGPLDSRMLRGGSWYRTSFWARVSLRGINTPTIGANYIGFRCIRGF